MVWIKKHWGLLVAAVLTLAFVVAEGYVLWYKGDATIGLVLLVIWLFVTRLETGFLLMTFLTPFAINIALLPGMELSMPVEPMMILFSGIFFFRLLATRSYDPRLVRHPVTLPLLASLAWMLFTSVTSEMPWVSIKYTLARVWFVTPFFFAAAHFFQQQKRIHQFFWAYAIGLGVVILIATSKTLGNFSDLQTLHRVMRPFYNDHTAYGCVIALLLPAAFYFIFSHSMKGWRRVLSLALFAGLCIGLFFSYCRAAWISVVGALGVYALIRMGDIKHHHRRLQSGAPKPLGFGFPHVGREPRAGLRPRHLPVSLCRLSA